MPQPDLVIFDCDGVLVDSEIIAARVEAELITLAGYEISAEEIAENYAGLTFKDILMRIEEKSKIPFQASLIDRAEELVDRKLRSDVRAIEGVREAVASVTETGGTTGSRAAVESRSKTRYAWAVAAARGLALICLTQIGDVHRSEFVE